MDKLVTVVMSVHNEKKEYLETAISSICNQTYKNIEFLIIDDASNELCHNTLKDIIRPYSFIKLIVNKKNLGITKSLYNGIKQANGDYIARMDADDFSLPLRLETQVNFLEKNKNIDILGGAVVSFGLKSIYMSPCNGMSDEQIKAELFFTSSLCHPAVMIRKSFLMKYKLNYDCAVNKGQDYDFWERCSIYGKFHILKEIALYYRIHDKQITSQNKCEQDKTAEMVMKRRLARIGLVPTKAEYEAHLALKGIKSNVKLEQIESWANKLIEANRVNKLVDFEVFRKNIKKRLTLVQLKNKKFFCIDIISVINYIKELFMIKIFLKKELHYINIINLKSLNLRKK